MSTESINPGIYNVEYFSGSQVALYIGDVWVDEVTSISYAVSQARTPIYGYGDMLWRDVSKGPVIVQGQFTINFKEAGYLWLILDRYKRLIQGKESVLGKWATPFEGSSWSRQSNIELTTQVEQLIKGELSISEKNNWLLNLASLGYRPTSLTGFSTAEREKGKMSEAESLFEEFEDKVWGRTQEQLDIDTRRADDPRLNPFDIYVSFGDFAGDNTANHTIQKLSDVHILGTSKQVVIDGQSVQEAYSFIARNLV